MAQTPHSLPYPHPVGNAAAHAANLLGRREKRAAVHCTGGVLPGARR